MHKSKFHNFFFFLLYSQHIYQKIISKQNICFKDLLPILYTVVPQDNPSLETDCDMHTWFLIPI